MCIWILHMYNTTTYTYFTMYTIKWKFRCSFIVDCVWNVMAHAQKPDFVFRRNGRIHLNRPGRQFDRLLAAEVCGISGSNAGYTIFRGSVKGTGYWQSPVSPSLPLPCVTVCYHISTGLYKFNTQTAYNSKPSHNCHYQNTNFQSFIYSPTDAPVSCLKKQYQNLH